MAAILTMQARRLAGFGDVEPALLDMRGLAHRTALAIRVQRQVRMRWRPCSDLVVDALEQMHVLRVISAHDPPRLGIAIDAPAPERCARIRNLPSDFEIAAEVVQLVAIEFENATGNL